MKKQTYNDGVASVYSIRNRSAPGNTPVNELTLKCTLRFNNKVIGVKRFWEAKSKNIDINKLIRVPFNNLLNGTEIIVIDDKQFEIKQFQIVYDDDNNKNYDMSLQSIFKELPYAVS